MLRRWTFSNMHIFVVLFRCPVLTSEIAHDGIMPTISLHSQHVLASLRWRHVSAPQLNCLLGVVTQPTDIRLSETTHVFTWITFWSQLKEGQREIVCDIPKAMYCRSTTNSGHHRGTFILRYHKNQIIMTTLRQSIVYVSRKLCQISSKG